MTVGGLDRERLARVVKRERTRRGLSVREAARLAGVDRDTWAGVESASRLPRDAKAALMEPVVGLGPGSFDALLAGRNPVPLPDEQTGDLRSDPDYRKWIVGYRRLRAKGYSYGEIIDALTDEEQSDVQDAPRTAYRRDAG